MAKTRISINYSEVGKLLRSSEMRSVVGNAASGIASRCGSGYSSDVKNMGTRVIASAFAETDEARQDNMNNNTLLKEGSHL